MCLEKKNYREKKKREGLNKLKKQEPNKVHRPKSGKITGGQKISSDRGGKRGGGSTVRGRSGSPRSKTEADYLEPWSHPPGRRVPQAVGFHCQHSRHGFGISPRGGPSKKKNRIEVSSEPKGVGNRRHGIERGKASGQKTSEGRKKPEFKGRRIRLQSSSCHHYGKACGSPG